MARVGLVLVLVVGVYSTATKYSLTDAAKHGAVCLDGTASAYYYRAGFGSGVDKWYIHHQGGGWCESIDDCYKRSKTDLGSSANYPPTYSLGGGYFSNNQSVNPLMYNWNMVYMRYCDGGSFTGNNATTTVYMNTTLYFRGKLILDAMITDILQNRGMSHATDAVISGCSAGGLATYLHVDHWVSRLPSGVKVVGLPDSGFFLDYSAGKDYHSSLVWVFNQMNSSSGINQMCIKASTSDPSRCIFAEHVSPYIQTPLFPLQAQYDSWQTDNELGSTDPGAINGYGDLLVKTIVTFLLSNPIHGVFLDSCHHHCGEWGEITIDGMNQGEAFMEWYNNHDSGGKRFWIQDKVYPCDSCCHPQTS